MIPIAISVAVVAWAAYASLLALRIGLNLRKERAKHAKEIEDRLQIQNDLHAYLLNDVYRNLAKQDKELVKLRKAAQKRGANGQYIKK